MKYEKKTRAAIKIRKNYNENDLFNAAHMNDSTAKKKKKKNKTVRKKDEENILSKDIDVDQEMRELERINENRLKNKENPNLNYSKNYAKNIRFKPQKYKGNYLPYHLRWIFNNTVVNIII
jgi:hypothetical protein